MPNENQKSNPKEKDTGQLLRDLLGVGSAFQQLNPLQENVLKSVQKVHKKQVEEAMQQGASGEQVLKDAGISTAPQQPTAEEGKQAISTLVGQQPPELQQPTEAPQRREWLGGLLKESPGMYRQRIENALLVQKLTGQIPLQKGEKEKIELTADLQAINKVVGQGLQKPLSGEAAKMIGTVNLGLKQVDALSTSFGKDPNLFKAIWTLGNPQAQVVRTSITNLWDTIARMRTGAAINENEEKLYQSLVPLVGRRARFETAESVKFKLEMLNELFSDIKKGIQPEVRSQKALFVSQALEEGYGPSEIRKFLKQGR